MPRRVKEKVDFLEKQIDNVRGWLATHGTGSKTPRPQDLIDTFQQKLDFLKEIRDDYKQSLEKMEK